MSLPGGADAPRRQSTVQSRQLCNVRFLLSTLDCGLPLHRGQRFASSALTAPMTLSFVRRIERFVQQQQVPLIQFAKGQRIDYKHSDIKQYHQEGEALRTETTINDPRDFASGRRLHNLAQLRKIGFQANRRLLDVQRISHDGALGEQALAQLERPTVADGQRVSGLRLSDTRVQALLSVLLLYFFLPLGFSHRDLRPKLAALLGWPPAAMTPGRMTYDLRRQRLHGLICRIPTTHRYELTPFGLRSALFLTRAYCRILRPGMSQLAPVVPALPAPIGVPLRKLEQALDQWRHRAKLAA